MFGTKASLAKIYGNSSFSSTTGNTPRSWRGVVYSLLCCFAQPRLRHANLAPGRSWKYNACDAQRLS